MEFQLAVILSLKGVITFITYQKFSFLFDIYEMDRYTLEQNWEILKTYFQSEVFNPNCKKFAQSGEMLMSIDRLAAAI